MARIYASVIITAGGLGKRFGGSLIKQFALFDGKPVIIHSVEVFTKCDLIDEIVLVVPESQVEHSRELLKRYRLTKVNKIVPGGKQRQYSVENGFNALSKSTGIVVVHDGARPFVTYDLIKSVIIEASNSGAAISALPAKDTIKLCYEDNYVNRTISRKSIWLAQTPQAFTCEILKDAYKKASKDGFVGTDEALLVERAGGKVKLVMGSPYNIKITERGDLQIAELISRARIHNTNQN